MYIRRKKRKARPVALSLQTGIGPTRPKTERLQQLYNTCVTKAIAANRKLQRSKNLPPDEQSRTENLLRDWQAKAVQCRAELDLRGNEAMTELLCRSMYSHEDDEKEARADLKAHAIDNGLEEEEFDIRPVRWEKLTLGLFTDPNGLLTYHSAHIRWSQKTIRLPDEQMRRWQQWATILDIYPETGPNRREGPAPKPSLQRLFWLLTRLDPQLVSDSIRPLLEEDGFQK